MSLRPNSNLVISHKKTSRASYADREPLIDNEHVRVEKTVFSSNEWQLIAANSEVSIILTSDAPDDDLIEVIWIELKGTEPISPHIDTEPMHYPLVPMDTLTDNERVIVQRVQVEPGQWEGVHSHPGNQVFIHVKGGTWGGRLAGAELEETKSRSAGHVGWMDAIDLSAEHESGNVGDTIIDLVWVTLK